MATKSAGEFRNGMTLEIDGKVCQVMEFMHVKPGKGAAFVRVKLKDIINGGVVETTFRPTESFQEAFIERKKMQYLYNDGDLYYFMDNETFDQIAVQFIQFVRIVENQCRDDRTIHTANNGIIHLNEMQNAVVVCGVDVVQVLTPLRGFLMDGDRTVMDFTVYFDTGIEYIYSC